MKAVCSLDLQILRAINVDRARYWHGGSINGWSALEWAGAMCGEAGEAANIAKKLKRVDSKIHSENNAERAELVRKLAKELADTVIYADLLAAREGIDLCDAIVGTFNQVSIRESMPHRLITDVVTGSSHGAKAPTYDGQVAGNRGVVD